MQFEHSANREQQPDDSMPEKIKVMAGQITSSVLFPKIPPEGGERVRQSSEPCQVVWNLDVKTDSSAKEGG